MTKKKKYPDGGTITTGTPEYDAYLQKQNLYNQYNTINQNLTNSGFYSNPQIASQAEIAAYQNRLGSHTFEQDPTGYMKYSYDPSAGTYQGNIGTSNFYDSGTGTIYVPYYDEPKAEIVKSEADIQAEQKVLQNQQLLQQFQGEVHEVVYNPQTGQNEVVKKQIPVGTDITDLVGSGKYYPYQLAFGGDIFSNPQLLNSATSALGNLPVNQNQLDPYAGQDTFNSLRGTVSKINPIFTAIDTAAKVGENVTGNLLGNALNDSDKGNRISKSFFNPFGSLMPLLQNDNATAGQKALGLLTGGVGTSGFINDKLAKEAEGKQNMEAFLKNKSLQTFPNGGEMNVPITYGNVVIDADPANTPLEFDSPFYATERDYNSMLNYAGVPIDKNPTQNQMNYIQNILPVHQNEQSNLYQVFAPSANREQQQQDFYNKQNQIWSNTQLVQHCMGGKMKYANGGDFIQYNGPTHEGGGIPIDSNGMPNSINPTAEVEGNETMYDNDISKYIFSDRLMYDPKNKITFADQSKKINKKYKNDSDKIKEDTRKLELERLKSEQEIFKYSISQDQNTQQFKWGGKYPDGGIFNTHITSQPNAILTGQDIPLDALNQVTPFTQLPSPWIGSQQDYNLANPINPNINITEPNPTFDEIHGDYTTIYNPITGEPTQIRSQRLQNIISNQNIPQQEGQLPQDKINPLGYAASNVGNVYDLVQAARPLEANKFGYVDLSTIDLSNQRRELEKQAGLSKDINRENVRSLATSSGQALSNQVIANALINSNLSSGLSESFMNEANANTQIKNQQELTNAQIKQQEIIANQMDKAKRQSTASQALHSLSMNTQGYLRDLKSAEVGNKNNQMWFDAIKTGKYVNLGLDANGNPVLRLPDGRIISKQ